jgi:hypothetical protein
MPVKRLRVALRPLAGRLMWNIAPVKMTARDTLEEIRMT